MILVENLSRFYGDFQALDRVSFRVDRGDIVGFLGPNGAGKTTTMRIMTGSLAASTGRVLIDGVSVEDQKSGFRSVLGYLPERAPTYPEMRVVDFLSFVARIRAVDVRSSVPRVMERCGLNGMAHRPIGALSKGYRQRVGLAQALIHDPDILILDEPTSGLDPNQIREIISLVRSFAGERTVLFSSHILGEVEAIANRVVVLDGGRVVADEEMTALRQRTAGDQLCLKVRGPQTDELERRVHALEGVVDIEAKKNANDDTTVLTIRAVAGDRIRGELARLVVEGGWELIELSTESLDLDQVFEQLTGGAP